MTAVPPPPVRTPIWTEDGMPPVWQRWFAQLYNRAGGPTAPTNTDFDVLGTFESTSAEPRLDADSMEVQSLLAGAGRDAVLLRALEEIRAALVLIDDRPRPQPQNYTRPILLMGG